MARTTGKPNNIANIGFEAKLWFAADKHRNNIGRGGPNDQPLANGTIRAVKLHADPPFIHHRNNKENQYVV